MKHMPDRYFHFRQLPFKEIKIKKNVCYSYPHFFPFPMLFLFLYLISDFFCLKSFLWTFLVLQICWQVILLSFCFSGKIYLSASFLKGIFTGHRILSWFFFSSSLKGWLNGLLLALFLTVNLFWLPIFVPPENVFFLWLLWKISLYLWVSAVWLWGV